MVICWHPEKPFPYEYSLPLPKKEVDQSVLQVSSAEVAGVCRKKDTSEIANEMARLTYTTKHVWFPRSRDKKRRKVEPDRTYL